VAPLLLVKNLKTTMFPLRQRRKCTDKHSNITLTNNSRLNHHLLHKLNQIVLMNRQRKQHKGEKEKES
jgi:hypothetical protein